MLSKHRRQGSVEYTGENEGRADEVRITDAGSAYLRTHIYKGTGTKYDAGEAVPRPDGECKGTPPNSSGLWEGAL